MQKKIKFLLSLLVVLAMIVLAACGNGADTPADSNGDVSDQSGVATKSFTDSTNRVVDVPAKVERIVPSGPLTQMMMLAIAPDLMVGLSSEWAEAETFVPEQYRALPITGQLYGGKGELNLEQIAAVDSQLIVDVGEPKGTIAEDMDELTKQIGIPAVHITATLDDMAGAYRLLGQLLGREEKGEELASYCEKIYNRTLDIMDRVGEENKISILNCGGDVGLNVIAKGSYHAQMLDLLCDNLAVVPEPTSKGTGNEVDMEQLLLWDPAVILFSPQSIYAQVGSDPAWLELSAIKNGTYYEVPFGPYNWLGSPPSINRYLGLIWLPKLLYPTYAEYDLYQEAAQYYKLFYDYELSEEEFTTLTANALAK